MSIHLEEFTKDRMKDYMEPIKNYLKNINIINNFVKRSC